MAVLPITSALPFSSAAMVPSNSGDAHRKRARVTRVALCIAVLCAMLVAICVPAGRGRDVLFGRHNADPSMPAPMLAEDDEAMPSGSEEWGGVGPGGTFLGRSMSKRRRIIHNDQELWKKAEEGIGNLIAMSKGEWHPPSHAGTSASRDRDRDGPRVNEAYRSRTPDQEPRHNSYDEGRASRLSSARRFRAREYVNSAEDFAPQDYTHALERRHRSERRAVDERRRNSLEKALQGPAEDVHSRVPADATGHDVAALRTAISRMNDALGSTKERLEEAVRHDERREQRAWDRQRASSEMRSFPRTSKLAASPGPDPTATSDSAKQRANSAAPTADGAVRIDAVGHKIEWPLAHAPVEPPSDTEEAAETIKDSISGLESVVGAVERRLNGFMTKASTQSVRRRHSDLGRQFRQKWGSVSAQVEKRAKALEVLQSQASSHRSEGASAGIRHAQSHHDDPEQAPHKKVFMPNALSQLAAKPPSRHGSHEREDTKIRRLEEEVASIEGKISKLSSGVPDLHAQDGQREEALHVRADERDDDEAAPDVRVRRGWEEMREDANGGASSPEALRLGERAADDDDEGGGRGPGEAGTVYSAALNEGTGVDVDDVLKEQAGRQAGLADVDQSPPTWALYTPQQEQAVDGYDDLDPHYASDVSPRDAYRRQLTQMVDTTSAGDPFMLPTDIINRQVHRQLPEMSDVSTAAGSASKEASVAAVPLAPSLLFASSGGGGDGSAAARMQDLAQVPAMMMGQERGGTGTMVGGTGDGQMPVMPVATTWYESAPTQTYESVPEATSRSLDEPAYAAVDEPVYAASVEEPMYASLAAPAAADATSRSVAYAPSQGQTNGAPVNVEGPQLALEQQGTDAEGTGAREAVKSVDASAKMQRAESPFRMPSLKWVQPKKPMTEQQQMYHNEEEALAAVNKAIPTILKAGQIVHKVADSKAKSQTLAAAQPVFF